MPATPSIGTHTRMGKGNAKRRKVSVANNHAGEAVNADLKSRQISDSTTHQKHRKNPKNSRHSSIRIALASMVAADPVILALSLIFGGCCSNVFTLEAIVKQQPTSGILITFVQFLMVASEGFIHFFHPFAPGSKFPELSKSPVPMRAWIWPVCLFFSVSSLSNIVLQFNVSVPLHIIARSSGTVTTMLLGLILGKRYSRKQIIGVLVLTMGILVAMMEGFFKSKNKKEEPIPKTSEADGKNLILSKDSTRYVIGLFILLACSIIGSLQGLAAENLYLKYGKRWREWLFFSHALAIPLFMPAIKDIYKEFVVVANSEPRVLIGMAGLEMSISYRMCYLILNALTQYVCVRGVNQLAGSVSALAVTVALTVRKCISMILSIYIFGNPLTLSLFIGTCFVFGGASLYAS